MARTVMLTAWVAIAVLWCCSRVASAGNQHFVERVRKAQQGQKQLVWEQAPLPDADQFAAFSAGDMRRRIARLRLPPSLGDALGKALSYEANRSRLSVARWRSRLLHDSSSDSSTTTTSSSSDWSTDKSISSSSGSSSGSSDGGSSGSSSGSSDGGRSGSSSGSSDGVSSTTTSVSSDGGSSTTNSGGSDGIGSWPVEDRWSVDSLAGGRHGQPQLKLPPLLRSALDTALPSDSGGGYTTHRPEHNRHGRGYTTHRPEHSGHGRGYTTHRPEHSGHGRGYTTHRPEHSRRLNITESRQGCNCSGVTTALDRTLSFLISHLPGPESALLDLHLPIISDPFSPPLAGTATTDTRLALCAPGGAGRSVAAALRLKRAPRRPRWRHAIIGDHLAPLRRRSAAGEQGEEEQCLQVVLPAGGAVTLDRSGYRLAHLTTRPLRRRRT